MIIAPLCSAPAPETVPLGVKSSPPPPAGGDPAGAPAAGAELEDDDPRAIRCRQCGEAITTPAFRVSVQGAHRHTFANPMGVVFEIGCFSRVRSVGYIGPETDEFTWFKGYRWRIALCGRCQVHLGWRFASGAADGFHALIIDRLSFPDTHA